MPESSKVALQPRSLCLPACTATAAGSRRTLCYTQSLPAPHRRATCVQADGQVGCRCPVHVHPTLCLIIARGSVKHTLTINNPLWAYILGQQSTHTRSVGAWS